MWDLRKIIHSCIWAPATSGHIVENSGLVSDLDKLNMTPDPLTSSLRYALEGIKESVRLLHDLPGRSRDEVTQIGFCGAPFTESICSARNRAERKKQTTPQ